MGNSAAKAFEASTVGTGTLTGKMGKCIAPSTVTAAPVKIKTKADIFNNKTTIMDEEGNLLYTFAGKIGFRTAKITVTDASGRLVCVGFGKAGMTTGKFRVLRPSPAFKGQPPAEEKYEETALYPFGVGALKSGMTSATCVYSITKGDEDGQPIHVPLYEATKISAMAFLFTVENMDGTLVAKIAQPGMDNRKLVGELGQGVDIVAVLTLSTFVGLATGSAGGSVGGLAGAGVI